jgi:single-stranded-DNA-specific exonuclease
VPTELLEPRLEVDEVLGVEDVSWDLLDEVSRLRPFGAGNPAPVFVLEGCDVERVKVMGQKGAHVRLQGRGFPEHLDPVGFHLRGVCDRSMADGPSVDLAFQLGDDEWMGRKRIQMRLEDLRAASGVQA